MGTYQLYDYDYGNFTNTCPDGFMQTTVDTADQWIHHVTGSLAYAIIIFNTLVIHFFRKSKDITPVSLILLSLAVSDTLSAICQGLPKHIGLVFGLFDNPGSEFSLVRVDYCFFVQLVSGPLFYTMNDISMALTTLLGIIKLLAVQFPMWFRINVKKKMITIAEFIIVLVAMVIELHPVVMFVFPSDDEGFCCNNEAYGNYVYEYSVVAQWILPLIYIASFVSMIVSTCMIIGKLFCCRSNANIVKVSDHTRAKHKKMAVNVVLITIIYIITEAMDFSIVLSPLMAIVFGMDDLFHFENFRIAIRYQRIIRAVGFASNFLIYLSTLQEFRKSLKKMFDPCCAGSRSGVPSQNSQNTLSTVSTSQTQPTVEN